MPEVSTYGVWTNEVGVGKVRSGVFFADPSYTQLGTPIHPRAWVAPRAHLAALHQHVSGEGRQPFICLLLCSTPLDGQKLQTSLDGAVVSATIVHFRLRI